MNQKLPVFVSYTPDLWHWFGKAAYSDPEALDPVFVQDRQDIRDFHHECLRCGPFGEVAND